MSLRPSTAAAIQDMPPPGGYKKLDFTDLSQTEDQKDGNSGPEPPPSSCTVITKSEKPTRHASNKKMQERKVRYALAPLMQAEADREY
eukprot:CAMPEP_0113405068 /NCGR_PEP_ID=MMETSP0013_2-20120614/18745_1 /TAXON_ID=2843 ORGANISM="Skeletonema costatum, Strain 1716" /NCGR_SAMPLE_ID=MMETSP0013_2 /ASSEMBLY_ACC=CAM_ASM_000158 /LENGTH=87 /DNA_ID=CAMNT_0000290751 /DNA_START=29 /DNA_END=290 /DNA_ORIENTATION=+ /assembly_acc=CAM_ASM_000158